jgi:hypothetical protein
MRIQDNASHGEAVELPGPAASTTAGQTPKESIHVAQSVEADSLEAANNHHVSVTKSTPADDIHMKRMGKEQQLVRNFHQLSVTSFTALSVAAWEMGLFLISPGLINGGRAGLMWSSLWCAIGFGPVYDRSD